MVNVRLLLAEGVEGLKRENFVSTLTGTGLFGNQAVISPDFSEGRRTALFLFSDTVKHHHGFILIFVC